MKKIPTLFKREYANHKVVGITNEVTPGMEWVLEGEGEATIKFDGACCAVIDGVFYKRFDAKKGRKIPEGAIPCCEPDPITGHWPHWVKVDKNNPADKWFVEAYRNTFHVDTDYNSTYEAVGPHFQGNPYNLDKDELCEHGSTGVVDIERSFAGIRDYLKNHRVEGIVFWKDDEPQCKIKRTDFGFEWPIKNAGNGGGME